MELISFLGKLFGYTPEITTKIAHTQIFGYFSPNNMNFYAETIVGTIIVHQNP